MADENTPATKKDLREVEESMGAMEERLSEQIRDMQTELLKAFLPWQDQVRSRFCGAGWHPAGPIANRPR